MPRRLLRVNVVLGLLCLVFGVGIGRSLLIRHPLPAAPTLLTGMAAAPIAAPAPHGLGLETYAAIADQNLFNPSRRETAAMAVVAAVKPILHGVVIEGLKSRAFLEDPSVNRVGGYSEGDPVAGGKLQKITDDRVVIVRPEGLVEVLLKDPAKPRPTSPAPAAPVAAGAPGPAVPGLQGSSPAAGQPIPVTPAPARVALQSPGIAPSPVVTSAPDHVLGQVLPSDTPGNLPLVVPSQGQRRVMPTGTPRQ